MPIQLSKKTTSCMILLFLYDFISANFLKLLVHQRKRSKSVQSFKTASNFGVMPASPGPLAMEFPHADISTCGNAFPSPTSHQCKLSKPKLNTGHMHTSMIRTAHLLCTCVVPRYIAMSLPPGTWRHVGLLGLLPLGLIHGSGPLYETA